MTSPFACDLETFKKLVAQFCRHADNGVRGEPLDAAFKCVGLHYLNLTGDAADLYLAVTYYEFAARRFAAANL